MIRLERLSSFLALAVLALLALLTACSPPSAESPARPTTDSTAGGALPADPHSAARPAEAAVRHLDLDLEVDFAARQLRGRASLHVDPSDAPRTLRLDTRDLEIFSVTAGADESEVEWDLEPANPLLGRALAIELPPGTSVVHVGYATSPAAAALQWLNPEQTAGGVYPFLFTQSQAILARTWVPCQDTPAVRFTYEATVRITDPELRGKLLALMSAENPQATSADGVYSFSMPQPIPSYLLALAVGELEFRALGGQSGVYAEPPVIDRAAAEFSETEDMIAAAERLYGPYRWGRYDLLVLPPSFPFGGMENPRLTFVTPTVLAGDRSLVALVAHELAHSWSGNLVTNATWNEFWLNEGFTTYFERRIMEELRGHDYAEMLALLGRQDLEADLADLPPEDTRLHLELEGRDPDDGMTDVAYEKGAFFLRRLEEAVGRERFDAFLSDYFDRHAFASMTTAAFIEELRRELGPDLGVDVEAWIYQPGLPKDFPAVDSPAFAAVEAQATAWLGGRPAAELDTAAWTTHEWLHFLRTLPQPLDAAQMAELDAAFGFTATGNAEILHAWLLHAIATDWQPAYGALEDFLKGMGRRKFLRPLYRALAATEEGRERARRIYAEARPTYHPMGMQAVDEILSWQEQ